jgi:hypothetical protein
MGEMNSFFKTNGPQEDIIKDIMNNFGASLVNEDCEIKKIKRKNTKGHLRKNVNSMENNATSIHHPKKLRYSNKQKI